jgi:hypothetical protein
VFHNSPSRTRELKVTTIELHAGGRHTYDWVLPGAPKGSFVSLLSPPEGHAPLGTMPHILASVVRDLFAILWRNPPRQGCLRLDSGEVCAHLNISLKQNLNAYKQNCYNRSIALTTLWQKKRFWHDIVEKRNISVVGDFYYCLEKAYFVREKKWILVNGMVLRSTGF